MKRPRIITVICIFGYISVLFAFPQVFSPGIKKLGVFVPALYGILVAAHFMSCVGLWYFKRWGAQLYLLAFFARSLFILLTDQAGVMFVLNVLANAVFIFYIMRHHPRMDANL